MKALILASNKHQFIDFCYNFGFVIGEVQYCRGGREDASLYMDRDTPVILLEGYERNLNYSVATVQTIGVRYHNIGYLSENELWANVPTATYIYTDKGIEVDESLGIRPFGELQ